MNFEGNPMDIEKAMKNPATVFGTPAAVCRSPELSREQKRAVLRQWQDQLQLEQTADDENMSKASARDTTAERLQQVTEALIQLDAA